MRQKCPLCGQETNMAVSGTFACDSCGRMLREIRVDTDMLLTAAGPMHPNEEKAIELVRRSQGEGKPEKRRKLILEAIDLCHDCLEAHRALLYLGWLGDKQHKKLDLHNIKSYLLHVFHEPEAESEDMRRQMIEELVNGPELNTCLALAPDRELFIREYLMHLCRQYITVFLKGDSSIAGRFMGLQLGSIQPRVARWVVVMMDNADKADLPDPFRRMLPECLRDAFVMDIGGAAYLDDARREQ
ncbi:MAG: hypothetical protein Q4C54_10045 [Clostridia bacterium]|nr:hypothetical protein [Clostridia bacterium]